MRKLYAEVEDFTEWELQLAKNGPLIGSSSCELFMCIAIAPKDLSKVPIMLSTVHAY